MRLPKSPAVDPVGMTASSRRFLIMALLFVTVVINYLDRSNLSIAAPGISSDFGLTPVQLGVVFSAFGWSYTPLQIPGGWLVDRVHPRVLYPLHLLLVHRDAVSWPVHRPGHADHPAHDGRIVRSAQLPDEQPHRHNLVRRSARRATCIAVYTSAEFVGLAFLSPLLAWLKVSFGWPAVFVFTGISAWHGRWRSGAPTTIRRNFPASIRRKSS